MVTTVKLLTDCDVIDEVTPIYYNESNIPFSRIGFNTNWLRKLSFRNSSILCDHSMLVSVWQSIWGRLKSHKITDSVLCSGGRSTRYMHCQVHGLVRRPVGARYVNCRFVLSYLNITRVLIFVSFAVAARG